MNGITSRPNTRSVRDVPPISRVVPVSWIELLTPELVVVFTGGVFRAVRRVKGLLVLYCDLHRVEARLAHTEVVHRVILKLHVVLGVVVDQFAGLLDGLEPFVRVGFVTEVILNSAVTAQKTCGGWSRFFFRNRSPRQLNSSTCTKSPIIVFPCWIALQERRAYGVAADNPFSFCLRQYLPTTQTFFSECTCPVFC